MLRMAKNSHDPEDKLPLPDRWDGIKKSLSDRLNGATKPDPGKSRARQGDFFRAVKHKRADVVLHLIEEGGIDLNAYNDKGQTALHMAAMADAADIVRLLISRGVNPGIGRLDKPDHTPLEDAVIFQRPEITELLAQYGGYHRGTMVNSWSLLHRACTKADVRVVEALLKAGADCNEQTVNGSTPLLIAVMHGRVEVVKALLRASGVLENMNGFFVKTDAKKRTAFQLAVDHGRTEIVAAMIKSGANVNGCTAEGRTPLMCAIDQGNGALVRLLVEAGADLNKAVSSFGTPLVYICGTQEISEEIQVEMIRLLIQLGADPDVPALGDEKMTPLIRAVENKSRACVECLLECGAHPALLDGRGRSAASYAYEYQQRSIVAILEKAAAEKTAKNPLPPRPPSSFKGRDL